ncbi:MAG: hypothetical protein QOH89_502 [Pseudonocardiales bacterium]|nr:hypothetical protein [Pseudonocardiales bacterium]
MAQGKSAGGGGLLESLRNSPETKRLTEEARHLFSAGSGRLTGKLGDGVSGAAKKLTDIGDSGSLGVKGEGAKRMLGGDGPVKSAVGAVTDKAKGLLGKGGKGGGKSKAMNIEETIDIGVPVSVAYNQWTQFQDFSRFMKGVESVEQSDETELTWRAKVFKSTRTWKANIQEQVPDRRVVWTSEGSKGTTKGVVTFHPLADDLTRVLVALEYFPSGIVEKTGNIWRAAGRRVRLDLKNFRRFVMMENEETGSWRGEIRDGEVVKGPEEDQRPAPRKSSKSEDSSRQRPAKSAPDRKQARKRAPAAQSSGSSPRKSASDTPRKRARKRAPAAQSTSANGSPRKQAAKRAPAAKSTSANGSPRKQASTRAPAKKSTGASRTPRKQATSRAPAKKQASQRAPAKKSAGSSRTPRKQPAKRAAPRKRTSR